MSMLVSGRRPVAFRPPGSAVTYLLQPPTPYSWAEMARLTAARGAVSHGGFDMGRRLKAAIDRAWSTEEAPHFIKIVEQHLAMLSAMASRGPDAPPLTEEEAKEAAESIVRYGELAEEARRRDPTFAQAEADNVFHGEIQAIEAIRLHVVGWENGPAEFRRAQGLLPLGLMELIQDDLRALWVEIARLRSPSKDEEKNSSSPSSGPSEGGNSSTPKPAAGP